MKLYKTEYKTDKEIIEINQSHNPSFPKHKLGDTISIFVNEDGVFRETYGTIIEIKQYVEGIDEHQSIYYFS